MLDDIMAFILLYEQKNFTLTAELLNIQPPTLSKKIYALEESLGDRLIIRTTRSFKPTKFGNYVYNKFKHLPSFTQEAFASYHKNNHKNTKQVGELNLCLGSGLAYELICPKIDQFIQKYPNIKLNFEFIPNIKEWPINKNVDLLLAVDYIKGNNLDNRFLRKEFAHFYCRTNYKLKYGLPTKPEDLLKHRLIGGLYEVNSKVEFPIMNNRYLCKEYILDASHTIMNVNNPLHCKVIGLNTDAIFLNFDSFCEKEIADGLLTKVLPDWDLGSIEYYIVTKKQITPITQAFIDFIYQAVSKE